MKMDLANILKELGAKSSLLWGVAIGSTISLLVDRFVSPLGVAADWKWVLPTVAILAWSILLTGLVASWAPMVRDWWRGRAHRAKRGDYGVRNLLTAGGFERAVLMHYKRVGQQRFRARRNAHTFHEMVRLGFTEYDNFDDNAWMQHYVITDAVWKFLDAPPADWDQVRVLEDINWE